MSQERSGACRARGTRIVPLFGGRKVDLRTAEDLSRYFREDVLKRRSSNMRKEDEVCLRHMRDAAREALGFVQGRTRADLNSDRIAESLLMCDATVGSARSTLAGDRREGECRNVNVCAVWNLSSMTRETGGVVTCRNVDVVLTLK